MDNDPHFIIHLPKSQKNICFNINSEPGKILNLVSDPGTGKGAKHGLFYSTNFFAFVWMMFGGTRGIAYNRDCVLARVWPAGWRKWLFPSTSGISCPVWALPVQERCWQTGLNSVVAFKMILGLEQGTERERLRQLDLMVWPSLNKEVVDPWWDLLLCSTTWAEGEGEASHLGTRGYRNKVQQVKSE